MLIGEDGIGEKRSGQERRGYETTERFGIGEQIEEKGRGQDSKGGSYLPLH
jgi:hypothetical protein